VLVQETGGNRDVAWNYVEFEVRYESLADELKIGDHYVRLLLEQGTHTGQYIGSSGRRYMQSSILRGDACARVRERERDYHTRGRAV
jgi:hypothetical protein